MNFTIAKDMQYNVGNEKYFKLFFPAEFQLFQTKSKDGEISYNSSWVRDLQLNKKTLNAHNKMFLGKLVKLSGNDISFKTKKDAIDFILNHFQYEE